MALYLVRHGETDWNRQKRFQARTDIALNKTGLAQAARLRDYLRRADVRFAHARCSPLIRARATAEIILEGSHVDLVIDETLLELSVGAFEGRLESELRAQLGEAFDTWRTKHFTERAPDGETVMQAMTRVADTLELVKREALTSDVLIVAHQGINMAMMAAVSGRIDLESLADFKQRNDQVEIWDTQRGQRSARVDI